MTRLFDADSVLQTFSLFRVADKTAGVLKAEKLTPDSDAVLLKTSFNTEDFFVLYIEDYIESLDYIKKQIERWFESKIIKFILPEKQLKFMESKGAKYYGSPDNK